MNLFVLAGIKSISNLFDGSFFVPYLLSAILENSKMTDTLYCLSVWNVVKDHLAYRVATALLPESECKGKAIF